MSAAAHPRWKPGRPIEIIAGTPPGGGQDRAARAIAAALEEVLDLQVSVSNTPGRGGGNGWDRLATHRGDQHIVSISSATLLTNRLTGVADLAYDDLSQLALLCTEFIAFAVPAESQLVSPLDLLEVLSAPNPPAVSLAVARGNVNHIALSFLCRHVGVNPRDVEVRVFDSARHAIADSLERANGIAAVSAASLLPEAETGSLRLLATSAPHRLGHPFRDISTWTELGVDCSIGTWRGLVGPPSLSEESLQLWDHTIGAAVATLSWQRSLSNHNWIDSYLSGAETRRFMQDEERHMQDGLGSLGLLTTD